MVEPTTRRRGFLKTVTVVLGGLVGVALAVPLVRAILFPAGRRTVDGPGEPVPVADASAVKAGGPPVRVEISSREQRDAWSKNENVRLGAAWLVKAPDGQVKAFSTTCPHLGCAVDYDPEAAKFRCPCHTSAFDPVSGERLAGPAKRGLDPLETTVDDKGRVLVKFQRFLLDTANRTKA